MQYQPKYPLCLSHDCPKIGIFTRYLVWYDVEIHRKLERKQEKNMFETKIGSKSVKNAYIILYVHSFDVISAEQKIEWLQR